MKIPKILANVLVLFLLSSCNDNKNIVSSYSSSESVSSNIQEIADFGVFINEFEYLTNQFKDIDKQILPDIIYAILSVSIDNNLIEMQVEIIEDTNNGKQYHVSNNLIDLWVSNNKIEIIYINEKYPLEPLPNYYLELYINYLEFKSETDNLIFVDLKRQTVNVFKNINGYFFLIKSFPCASGKTSTPTKRGLYKIYDKGPVFYNEVKFYKCYYWLKYSNKYLLHSIPYSLEGDPLNTSMSKKVSNGCVRMYYKDAKWLYENIQINTTIWIN